jgi:hypothetical protein
MGYREVWWSWGKLLPRDYINIANYTQDTDDDDTIDTPMVLRGKKRPFSLSSAIDPTESKTGTRKNEKKPWR